MSGYIDSIEVLEDTLSILLSVLNRSNKFYISSPAILSYFLTFFLK